MINTPISHGEYFDRLFILINKLWYTRDPISLRSIMMQIGEMTVQLYTVLSQEDCSIKEKKELYQTLIALRETNQMLWILEESVREALNDQEVRLEMSDQIRVLNADRAAAKKTIDQSFGDICEFKDYSTITK